MKAVVIPRHGGPEVLTVQERPDPTPGPGEIAVRVRASGVNFADLMARMGLYPDAPPPPCVVGYEVAGDVLALGPGVEGPAPGTRVLAPAMFGGYAEIVLAPATGVIPLPPGASYEDGAAIPVNYGTAYHLLHHMGALKPGETVFIQAAAGGVGLAVGDLVKAAGARLIGVASASKHEFLRERGVTDLIGRDEPVLAAVRRLTGGRGVDLWLDSEGGAGLEQAYQGLAPGGRLLCFGVSSMAPGEKRDMIRAGLEFLRMPRFSPVKLMNDNRGVLGVNMNTLAKAAPDLYGRHLQALMAMWAAGKLRPHVDAAFPPEKAGDAHRMLHDRKNRGKVVIAWP